MFIYVNMFQIVNWKTFGYKHIFQEYLQDIQSIA